MKKVVLTHIPTAIEQALREQLKTLVGVEVASFKEAAGSISGCDPDLVVTGVDIHVIGVPVLPLSLEKPQRLGVILRQITQMLAQPVLYIDDIVIGPCTFKPQEKALTRPEGEDIPLTDREVDILAYLARHRTKPVSRSELLKNVWQYHEGVDTHTLETHIYRLRQKIEVSADDPRLLLTVDGGYALHLPAGGV